MKLLTAVLAVSGYVHAMNDCAILNDSEQCAEGHTSPNCDIGEVCIRDDTDNPCSYSCLREDVCQIFQGYKLWRYAEEESNQNGENKAYVDYCAKNAYKSAYTCNLVDGVATVSATFGPIPRSHPERDNRECEFYHKQFDTTEYEYGMFGKATSDCTDLVNKTIDDEGYTTLTVALDGPDNARDACNIQFTEYRDKNTHYQQIGFAFGYERLMGWSPSGWSLFQPEKHTNIECELVFSGDVVTAFQVGHTRMDETVVDGDTLKFDMQLFIGQMDLRDEYALPQYLQLKLQYDAQVEQVEQAERFETAPNLRAEPQWIWIIASSESSDKYTHFEQCSLIALDINGEPMLEYAIIEEGCVSLFIESATGESIRMKNPRVKGKKADGFGIKVYDIGAASLKIECRLHACEYHTNNEKCRLRESCPYENRYENIFGKNLVRRGPIFNTDENVDSRTISVRFNADNIF